MIKPHGIYLSTKGFVKPEAGDALKNIGMNLLNKFYIKRTK